MGSGIDKAKSQRARFIMFLRGEADIPYSERRVDDRQL
jgi:hypothetical protein